MKRAALILFAFLVTESANSKGVCMSDCVHNHKVNVSGCRHHKKDSGYTKQSCNMGSCYLFGETEKTPKNFAVITLDTSDEIIVFLPSKDFEVFREAIDTSYVPIRAGPPDGKPIALFLQKESFLI